MVRRRIAGRGRLALLAPRAPLGQPVQPLIFGAACVAALGLLLTATSNPGEPRNFLAHFYKFVSYSLFFQAMFVVSVRKPYLRLEAQARMLASLND